MTSFHDGSAGIGAIFCFVISISIRTSIGFEGHGGMTALSKDRPLERAAYRASDEVWSKGSSSICVVQREHSGPEQVRAGSPIHR
ncbi:hypothetical protein N5I32_19855, partial [Acidimangrovimonas sediminis]|nr:hypothetical protein [Defluviimonas sediminis]